MIGEEFFIEEEVQADVESLDIVETPADSIFTGYTSSTAARKKCLLCSHVLLVNVFK
jgi:hypothetical protein